MYCVMGGIDFYMVANPDGSIGIYNHCPIRYHSDVPPAFTGWVCDPRMPVLETVFFGITEDEARIIIGRVPTWEDEPIGIHFELNREFGHGV